MEDGGVRVAPGVRAARVYDPPAPSDGVRILVDRLWPRGLTKQAAALDHWYRQIPPSTDLRTWYAHEPERFAEFVTSTAPNSVTRSGPPRWPHCANSAPGGWSPC